MSVAVAQLAACQLRSLSANVRGCTAASLPEWTVGVDSGSITGIRAQARAPQSALPLAPFLLPVLPRLPPQCCFLFVFLLRCHSRPFLPLPSLRPGRAVRAVPTPAIAQLAEHLAVDACSNQMVPGSVLGGRQGRAQDPLQVACGLDCDANVGGGFGSELLL